MKKQRAIQNIAVDEKVQLLKEYHSILVDAFENNYYNIFMIGTKPPIKIERFITEALHYMIYRYMLAHKDKRIPFILEYVLEPTKDIEIDFSYITFNDFLEFMISIKN